MKIKSIITMAVISGASLLGVFHSQAQMELSAGIGTPLNGDSFTIQAGQFRVIDDVTEYKKIRLLLDLEDVKNVEKFLLINATHADSNLNPRDVTVSVASDENDPGFDLYNVASYTEVIFSGTITPMSNFKGAIRNIDVTDITRQYFLFTFTNNLWGEFTHANADRKSILFNDIQVIPEPSTILLLLSSLGCLIIFRRRIHR